MTEPLFEIKTVRGLVIFAFVTMVSTGLFGEYLGEWSFWGGMGIGFAMFFVWLVINSIPELIEIISRFRKRVHQERTNK
ncbi:hypothetical protein HY967_00145 [Candidatus Jorgensenbacteria bacterium]|nr:hypothetical protein [Candidatus Jorgensenbacteria bacterium]